MLLKQVMFVYSFPNTHFIYAVTVKAIDCKQNFNSPARLIHLQSIDL